MSQKICLHLRIINIMREKYKCGRTNLVLDGLLIHDKRVSKRCKTEGEWCLRCYEK